jgi:heme/copper-type cytochrome/quinol oxidase subunit 4
MSKKKKESVRRKNQKKKNMNKIYTVSLILAEILTTILLNHFIK